MFSPPSSYLAAVRGFAWAIEHSRPSYVKRKDEAPAARLGRPGPLASPHRGGASSSGPPTRCYEESEVTEEAFTRKAAFVEQRAKPTVGLHRLES
jgi:hypothetical protein